MVICHRLEANTMCNFMSNESFKTLAVSNFNHIWCTHNSSQYVKGWVRECQGLGARLLVAQKCTSYRGGKMLKLNARHTDC